MTGRRKSRLSGHAWPGFGLIILLAGAQPIGAEDTSSRAVRIGNDATVQNAWSRSLSLANDAGGQVVVSRPLRIQVDSTPPTVVSRSLAAFNDVTAPNSIARSVSVLNSPFVAIANAVSPSLSIWNDATSANATSRQVAVLNDLSIPQDDGACTSGDVTFRWLEFQGANAYRLEIATSPQASAVIQTVVVNDELEYTLVAPQEGITYYARRSPSSDGGQTFGDPSPFSDGIVVDRTPPLAQVPVSSRVSLLGIRFTLAGSDNQQVTALRAQVSTNPTFEPLTHDTTLVLVGAGAILEISGQSGASYYARTQATDCAGNVSPFSESSAGVYVDYPADLVISALQSPIEGLTGQAFPISWSIQNESGLGAASGPWVDRVHISPDSILGNGNDIVLINAEFNGPLAPQQSITRSMALNFPANPGQHWLFVTTDAANSVEELQGEGNNSRRSATPVQVLLAPMPDLVVTSLSTPSNGVVSGSTITVDYTVTNQGTGSTATLWKDRFYLVPTNDPDTWRDATCLDVYPFLGEATNLTYLPPGESYSNKVSLQLPRDITGPYYVIAVADNRQAANPGRPCGGPCTFGGPCTINEIHETNNARFSEQFSVSLEPQPDLLVTGASFNTVAATGYPFTVNWNVQNQGDGPTDGGAWTEAVYLSTNRIGSIVPGDILLGSYNRTGQGLSPYAADPTHSLTAQIPARVFGVQHIKIVTDAANAITEFGLEGNNVFLSPDSINVALTGTPDLVPMSVAGPPSAVPGHLISITWFGQNASSAPVLFPQVWRDVIYLSTDEVQSPDDVLLATVGQNAIRTSTGDYTIPAYSGTATVKIPNVTTDGSYRVVVSLDREDQVFEWAPDYDAELNNAVASVGTIQVIGLATDLTATINFDPDLSAPDSGSIGDAVQLSWRVTNTGKEVTPASAWIDRVYLSVNATLSTDDVVLASRIHEGSLAAGASYEVTSTATVPGREPGQYFLIFVVDAGNAVYEEGMGEDNNVLTHPFVIPNSSPDLVVESLDGAHQAATGDSLHITWIIKNAGSASTPSGWWVDRVSLSSFGDPGAPSIPLGSRTTSGVLQVGESYTASLTIRLPSDLFGSYTLTLMTDVSGMLFESNEANNSRVMNEPLIISVAPSANLTVTSVEIPDSAIVGQPINISWHVRNTGSGTPSSPTWFDAVYLSTDQFLDRNRDIFIGEVQVDSLLPAGAEYTRSVTRVLPTGVSGRFFAIVTTDCRSNVFEPQGEHDNSESSAGLVSVFLPSPGNLVLDSVAYLNQTVLCGSSIPLDWHTRNIGTNPILGGWSDVFYISSDSTLDAEDRVLGVIEYVPEQGEVLLPGESITHQAEVEIPGVLPGTYWIIGSADATNRIVETSEADNGLSVPAALSIAVQELTLGVDFEDAGLSSGSDRFYRIQTTSGRTLQVSVQSALGAFLSLYAQYDTVPRAGRFDFIAEKANSTALSMTIPNTKNGDLYLHLRASGPTQSPVTIRIDDVPLSLEGVNPVVVGSGIVSITISGRRFSNSTAFSIMAASDSHEVTASGATVLDGTRALVRWDLRGASPGPYSVIATDSSGDQAAVLQEAITVEPERPQGAGFYLEPGPPIRRGTTALQTAYIVNTGNSDIPLCRVTLVNTEAPKVLFSTPETRASGSPPSIQGHRQVVELLVTQVAVGERRAIPIEIRVDRAASAGMLPIIGNAYVLPVEQFKYGRFTKSIAWVRERILQDPATSAELRTIAEDSTQYWGAVYSVFDSILDASTQVSGNVRWRTSGLASAGLASAGTYTPSNFSWCLGVTSFLILAGWTGPVATAAALYLNVCCFDGCLIESLCPNRSYCECAAEGDPRCGPCEDRGECDGQPPGDEACVTTYGVIKRRPNRDTYCAGLARPPRCYVMRLNPRSLQSGICEWYCQDWCRDKVTSDDPNEKIGIVGYGAEHWVAQEDSIAYQVFFENVADASAPAARVVIRDELTEGVDAGSFRVGQIQVGDRIISVPPGRSFFETRVDLTAERGVLLDITAGVNALANPPEAFWIFQSIDPATGLPPTDGLVGFLPPNDSLGVGEGSVSFSVRPKATVVSGTVIENEATITFDFESPIVTNTVSNVVDADAPVTHIEAVADSIETSEVVVPIVGADVGAGLLGRTLFVSTDGGTFVPYAEVLGDTSVVFRGEPGHQYGFMAVGSDNVGNVEALKDSAEVVVTLGAGLTVWPGDANNNGQVNQNDLLPIGLNFGLSGPARDDRGVNWQGRVVPRWTSVEATYADGNGNGTVNQNDILPIGLNFGQRRAVLDGVSRVQPQGTSGAKVLASVTIPPLPVGTEVPIEVFAESEEAKSEGIFGVALAARLPFEWLDLDSVIVSEALEKGGLLEFKRVDREAGQLALAYSKSRGDAAADLKAVSVVTFRLRVVREMTTEQVVSITEASVSTPDRIIENVGIKLSSTSLAGIPRVLSVAPLLANPFSASTTLNFGVPRTSEVTLDVYDVAGRLVSRVLDREVLAAGWHRTDINGADWASGVYIYQLRAGAERKSGKMVLVR